MLADRINQTIVGAGYVDDCFVLAMNYITDYSYSGNPTTNHRVMLQIGLRTIGTTTFNQSTTPSTSRLAVRPVASSATPLWFARH